LIWKIYGTNPLECPKCGGQRRLVAIVTNDKSLVRILNYYGESTELPKLQPARAPPVEDDELCQLEIREVVERRGTKEELNPEQSKQSTTRPAKPTLADLVARGVVFRAEEMRRVGKSR
jgi:hypothetical protein